MPDQISLPFGTNSIPVRLRVTQPQRTRLNAPLLSGLLAAVLAVGASLHADDTPADRDDIVQLDRFAVRTNRGNPAVVGLDTPATTASRLGLNARDIPASIEVIDGSVLRERGDASLTEAVTRATGVINLGAPGNGGTSVGARGFTGHGAVMQLYDSTRFYVGSGTVTFPFDPWMVERIEILHGPASVLWGDAATGGAINYIPRQPSTVAVANARFVAGENNTWQAAAGVGGPLGQNVFYRADASYRRSDTWLENNDTESLAFAGSLRWAVSPVFSVALSHDSGDQKPSRYFGTPLIGGRIDETVREVNFNVADSIVDYQDRWTRLKAAWQPSSDLEVTNQLYHLTSERHWKNAESYTWNSATSLLQRADYLEILHDQEQIGDRLAVSSRHDLGGLANRLCVGADANRIDFTHTNNSPYGGNSTVDPYAFAPGLFTSPVATTPGLKTHTRQASLFMEDHLRLSTAWAVTAGARYDWVDLRRTDLRTPSASFEKTYGYGNYRGGLVYTATPRLSLYAQYVTAADPVSGSLITTSSAQKDWDLTKSRQIEIGLKQSFWGQRGEWSLSAYRLAKTNLLSRDATNPALTVQIGEQSTRGLEANTSVALGHGVSVTANAAWLHAQYDDFAESVSGALVSRNGARPTNVPRFTGNLGFGWSFLRDWDLGADLRHVSQRYSDTANTKTVPAYTVVDLRLGWRATKHLAVALRLYNAFDRLYATTTGNSGGQWLLGRPQAVEFSTDLRF